MGTPDDIAERLASFFVAAFPGNVAIGPGRPDVFAHGTGFSLSPEAEP